jgi:hypothetical protein
MIKQLNWNITPQSIIQFISFVPQNKIFAYIEYIFVHVDYVVLACEEIGLFKYVISRFYF